MTTLGHGISQAVRNHIPIWVDDQLVDVLYGEYTKSGGVLSKENFGKRIKNSADWVRKGRKGITSGYERKYYCKTVQKATLVVYSPESDLSAKSYLFHMDGKPVAGGKTSLKSIQVSATLSKKDKTTTHPDNVQFVKYTEEELRKIRIQMEFGDGMENLEFEREA